MHDGSHVVENLTKYKGSMAFYTLMASSVAGFEAIKGQSSLWGHLRMREKYGRS